MNNRVKIDFDALDRWRATHGIDSEKEMCERAGLNPYTLKRIKSGARSLTLLTVEAFYNASTVLSLPPMMNSVSTNTHKTINR